MIMQVFINEKSLQGQFTHGNIEPAIKTFIATLAVLEKVKQRGPTFKSNVFFNEEAIKGVHLNSILVNSGDLLKGFLNNIKNAEKWEDSQLHDLNTMYSCLGDVVTGSSVAEIAERKSQNNLLPSLLVNFIDSTYSQDINLAVEKEESSIIELDCSHNETTVLSWLRLNDLVAKHDQYDESLRIPPLDDQTVLGGARFEITPYKNRGRRAFRLIGTNQLWSVDASEGHLFGKPHIEVFSEIDGLHMGTSIYNEINLDETRKVNLRRINLNRHYPIE